jgi:Protein of unknown function (DUF2845)
MNGRTSVAAVLAGLAAIVVSEALADTLRCGSKLVEEGESAQAVLAKCGEPASKEVRTEDVRARNASGGTRVVGTTKVEIWRYDRGSGKFPAILTFEDGVLKKLEFETD